MFVSVRPRRFLLAVAFVLFAAGCTGPDLSKQNFPRTTVTAAAPTGDVAGDSALSPAALRIIDPCALLDEQTLSALGSPERATTPDLDGCSRRVRDAGGKTLRIDLELGDIVIDVRDASGTVGGLPLVAGNPDGARCSVTGVISRSPGLGITAMIDYPGGDACGAGKTLLEKVVQRLRSAPPRRTIPPGSALAVDLCALPDPALMAEVLGRGTDAPAATGLHSCRWSGGVANGYLRLAETVAPMATEGQTPVDLGGVTGYQKEETYAGKRCQVSWVQRPLEEGRGEVISVEYENFHTDAGSDDACGKATRIARAVLPKLPRP